MPSYPVILRAVGAYATTQSKDPENPNRNNAATGNFLEKLICPLDAHCNIVQSCKKIAATRINTPFPATYSPIFHICDCQILQSLPWPTN
jgi:hypothetical protein